MRPDQEAPIAVPDDGRRRVSDRYLSELFVSLERHGIPPAELVGDLPISIDEHGHVTRSIHWDHFSTFLRRLEHRVGGSEGLERCGEWLCSARNNRTIRRILAFSTSPASLYRAATVWAAPRSIPGMDVRLVRESGNHLSIEIRLPEELRACPQVLHLATGAFRALPRFLGMPESVVSARVEERRAHYDITVPSSRSGLARLRRLVRSMFAPGSVLRHLEDRQLELHARHATLSRTLESLLASERRLRDLADAAVDMLCEIDETGRICFASASVRDLMGYSSEQVTGSHYRLWVPSELHDRATAGFEAFRAAPIGTAIVRERVVLHAAHGRRVSAQISIRSHRTREGAWRAVAILRDASPDVQAAPARPTAARPASPLAARSPSEGVSNLDRLRSGRAALRARHADHPLERSLTQLVALLESFESLELAADASTGGRMLEATLRMTRIVEHALVREQDGENASQWLETRKLVGRLRDARATRFESAELPLRIDVARGPAEIWGSEALLDACVTGLVDWAGERAKLSSVQTRPFGPISLSIESAAHCDPGAPEILLVVRLVDRSAVPGPEATHEHPLEQQRSHDAELALAIVRDAARALGGELVEPDPAHEGTVRTIRLPQPAGPAQSETRSMSAPMERSFSSIRS